MPSIKKRAYASQQAQLQQAKERGKAKKKMVPYKRKGK